MNFFSRLPSPSTKRFTYTNFSPQSAVSSATSTEQCQIENLVAPSAPVEAPRAAHRTPPMTTHAKKLITGDQEAGRFALNSSEQQDVPLVATTVHRASMKNSLWHWREALANSSALSDDPRTTTARAARSRSSPRGSTGSCSLNGSDSSTPRPATPVGAQMHRLCHDPRRCVDTFHVVLCHNL